MTPLSIDLRARLAAYAGLLAAYGAADPHASIGLALFGAAALWSLLLEPRRPGLFLPAPGKVALIGLGTVAFALFATGGASPDRFASALGRFLFWNATVFVLSRNKTDHDFWTMAIIQLSLFMISAAFVQPPAFFPLLLAGLFCFLYASQRMAILRCGPAGAIQKGGLGLALFVLLISLEIAAAVFLAFPRGSLRWNEGASLPPPPEGTPVETTESRVGPSNHPDRMDLTNLEKLKLDPRPALRIRITDLKGDLVSPERTQYLRGAVLDTYENGRWTASFRRQPFRDADDGSADGWTALEPAPRDSREIVRQHLRTPPLGGDLSFCLPDPVRVGWPEALYDPSGILFFPRPPGGPVEYDVESALMPTDVPPGFRSGGSPDPRHLQIPEGLEPLKDLARGLTARIDPDQTHARASRLAHYLMRNGFAYKLEPFVPSPGRDPVLHFLETREGYCAQYAAALALLCRAAGVPARVATGFQLHDPEPDGSFLVRNSDAHAWVEVGFGPDFGWRAYDATPSETRTPGEMPEGEAIATVDPGRPDAPSRWDRFLVDYGPDSQGEAVSGAFSRAGRALEGAGRLLVSPPVAGTLLGSVALAAAIYAFLPARQRRRLRQIAGGFRESTTVDFYRDFLWTLARRGLRKHPALTAREFARVARGRIADEGIDFVTGKFCETRYGGIAPSPDDRRRIEEILLRLSRPDRATDTGA